MEGVSFLSHYEEIAISGTIKASDFVLTNMYHFKKALIRNTIFVFLLVWMLFMLLAGELISSVISQGILALIVSFLAFFIWRVIIKRRALREYQSDQVIQHKIRYIISNDGVHQQSIRSTTNYQWSDIRLALEYKEMFLLYLSNQKVIILPKRFFESHDDVNTLKSFVTNNVAPDNITFH